MNTNTMNTVQLSDDMYRSILSAIEKGIFKQYIIDMNIDVNSRFICTSLLLIACKNKVPLDGIQYLVENGADIDYTVIRDANALVCACKNKNYFDVIQYLVKNGANVNSRCNTTPLLAACEHGLEFEVIQFLVEQGASTKPEGYKYTALSVAYSFGASRQVIQYLIDIGCNVNEKYYDDTLLLTCCKSQRDSVEEVQYLIDCGADVNVRDQDGMTPLMCLYIYYNKDTVPEWNTLDITICLTRHGADVNAISTYETTVLMYACIYYNNKQILDVVKHLIECGVDLNACDDNGKTALMHAYQNGQRRKAIFYMIEHGADVDVIDKYCDSTYSYYEAFGYNNH